MTLPCSSVLPRAVWHEQPPGTPQGARELQDPFRLRSTCGAVWAGEHGSLKQDSLEAVGLGTSMVKCPALERLAGCFVQQGFVSNDGRERILHTFPWASPEIGFGSGSSGMPGQCYGILVENIQECWVQAQPGTYSPIANPHSLGTCWMSPWLAPASPKMGCTHLPPQEPAACHKWMLTPLDAPLSGCPPHVWRRTPVRPPSLPRTHPAHTRLTHRCPQILGAASSWMSHTSGCPPTYVPLPSGCSAHIWIPPLPG